MPAVLLVHQLPHFVGEEVVINGWINSVRLQKNMQFLVLRDETGMVQLAHERKADMELATQLDTLTPESTVQIIGRVVANPAVKLGGIEIVITSVSIFTIAEPMPIDQDTAFERQMDYRWLTLRSKEGQLIMRVQTSVEEALRDYFNRHELIEIHSPKLMSVASENAGSELFALEYFGRTATLAQSPQLYKQMAMAAGLRRVFEIGPVFRANPSMTSRHDTEFTSVDVEMAWIDSVERVMEFEEAMIQSVMSHIARMHGYEIQQVFGQEVQVPQLPFPRLTLAEAAKYVAETGYRVPPETKGDLDPQAERIVGEIVKKYMQHDFVFLLDYPTSVRAFYHMRHQENPLLTHSFDLLYKGLEITTGAQREHRYAKLMNQAAEKGIDPASLGSYPQFFRYGMPPHGGFGFGLTRFLMKLLGFSNVREVTYIYRGPNRLTP